MANRPLTAAECKSAKATKRPIKLFDGGGLYLHVQPNGSKAWRMTFTNDGQCHTVTFGKYPDLSPQEP